MSGHRYWRLRCIEGNNPAQYSAAEVQFRTVVGGAMAYIGTPISSSNYASDYLPALAFDGDPSTAWAANRAAYNEWIGYDFGAGNAPDIVEVLYQARSGNDSAQSPNLAYVEYSDDAATWTQAWAATFGAFGSGQAITSAPPGPLPVLPARTAGFHSGTQILPGNSIASPDGYIILKYQNDGNVVLYNNYDGSTALWSPNTNSGNPGFLALNDDGNVVAYDNTGNGYWYANSYGNGPNAYFTLDDYGTFSVHKADGTVAYSQGGGVTPPPPPPPPENTQIEASEVRVFSVLRSSTLDLELSAARVFGIYRAFTPYLQASSVRTIDVINKHIALSVSQAQVLAVVKGRVANPVVRAWTFTLDGHDFYVLRLGDALTKLYDVATQQWTEWETPNSGAWKPNTGFSWIGAQALAHTYGSDVVVGDDTFGLLYFLDPKTPWDESPYGSGAQLPFDRIVSAQTLANGRQYLPCYAIFVGGDDYGLVARDFTPQITLETSDDQGRTFFAHDTLDVEIDPDVDGNYGWYSLGQIQSPGRIFRITDNGVFTRIDNVEMNDDAG